jgi:hypothetical protein
VRSEADIRLVFELWNDGLAKAEIARRTGVSRAQVRAWLDAGIVGVLSSPRRDHGYVQGRRCDGSCNLASDVDETAYAYLLGQYLGDGCISEARRHVFRLRLATCDAYPTIKAECEAAMRAVMPANTVGRVQRIGCTELYSNSKHWPCLFPQHGPGRKHLRRIALEPWQYRIALDLHPDRFLRGLIHSDGCRVMNNVTHRLATGTKQYAYPRYFFCNESADIRWLFIAACIYLEIEFRYTKANTISVAQRSSVAKLDSFVGPKR